MKRSEINQIIKDGIAFFKEMNFALPQFAYFSPEEWADKGSEYDEIRDNSLGWDITDFGSDNFHNKGLFLFTLRNGNLKNEKYSKPYAEKIMIVEENQVTPYHFHWSKMEDIINRGGAQLVIKVYNSTEDGAFAETDVDIYSDGRHFTVPAGGIVRLNPGESISIQQGMYHSFWAEGGKTLVGEVSMVNDDNNDNRFYEPQGRFPAVDEDEPAEYLLGNEYPNR